MKTIKKRVKTKNKAIDKEQGKNTKENVLTTEDDKTNANQDIGHKCGHKNSCLDSSDYGTTTDEEVFSEDSFPDGDSGFPGEVLCKHSFNFYEPSLGECRGCLDDLELSCNAIQVAPPN